MRIKGYVLKNIQSWDDKSGVINLCDDKMNVIIAPSETGKSVIIKVIKEMCFAGNWGYTWESLIRRGADFGVVAFVLENDCIVTYHIWPNRVRYAIIYPDKSIEPKVWEYSDSQHTEIPDEVANIMGLIIDRKGRTVVNVLDKDMVTPFVTAPPELNARIAAVITAVPEMELRRDTLREWKDQFTIATKNAEKRLNAAKMKYESAPEIDMLYYQLRLQRAETLMGVIKPLENMVTDFEYVNLPEPPKMVNSPKKCEDILDILDNCSDIIQLFQCVNNLIEPVEVYLDTKTIETVLEIHDILYEMNNISEDIINYNEPSPIFEPIQVEHILDILDSIVRYGKILSEDITPPTHVAKPPKDVGNIIDFIYRYMYREITILVDIAKLPTPKLVKIEEITSVMNILSVIDDMNLSNIETLLNDRDNIDINIYQLSVELDNMRRELKVCPTCGKPW